MIRVAGAGVVSSRRLRTSAPQILAVLLCLAGVVPDTDAQDSAVAQPCREEDDPPATFEYRGVQVTISESCWKRRVGNQCEELIKGWSTNWVAAEARKGIDRLKEGECLGPGIRAAAGERMQSLRVLCTPSVVWSLANPLARWPKSSFGSTPTLPVTTTVLMIVIGSPS